MWGSNELSLSADCRATKACKLRRTIRRREFHWPSVRSGERKAGQSARGCYSNQITSFCVVNCASCYLFKSFCLFKSWATFRNIVWCFCVKNYKLFFLQAEQVVTISGRPFPELSGTSTVILFWTGESIVFSTTVILWNSGYFWERRCMTTAITYSV